MRPQNNKISVRQRELDSNLQVNPIEDGNTPIANLNQGAIYTSELNDGYSDAYEGSITAIQSEKTRTGEDNFFIFDVQYSVDDETPNGWFGNNLIKEGEPFTIVNGTSAFNFNYIKGYVVNIVNKDVTTVGLTDVYDYRLLCAITEGDVSKLLQTGGQVFKTNRRIFSKETEYVAPINLYSTTKESNNKTLFFWEDTTNLAVNYQVRVRSADIVTYDEIKIASGNHADFRGSVEPLMFKPPQGVTGAVTTFKFTDVGLGFSAEELPLNFITSGTGPVAKLYTTNCGSLLTKLGEVKEVVAFGTNYAELNIQIKEGNSTFQIEPNNYIDLPIESKTKNAYVYSITMLNDYYATIEVTFENFTFNSYADAERQILNKNAEFHVANITSLGTGLTKTPKIYYDKYPTNTKFVWPTALAAGTYYWSVAACYNCEQKTYSEWSLEELLIIQ
jgi:hypothetical protein